MKQFNVSRRLVFLLGAFGAVAALAVIAFTVLLRQSLAASSEVAAEATVRLGRGYALLEQVAGIHAHLQTFLRLTDPDQIEKALSELEQQQKYGGDLIAAGGSHAVALQRNYDALIVAQKAVLEDVLRGSVAEAYDKFFSRAVLEYQALLTVLTQQNQAAQKAASVNLAARHAEAHRAMFWRSCTVSFVLAGLIVFGWRLKNHIVRELQRVSRVIAESSVLMAATIAQMSAGSQSLGEGASQQAASLEETSASLEEMSGMTKRNAENAARANDLAKQARIAAELGTGDMQTMSQAMSDIKASSDGIAKIIKTIDQIAFQTNILALNAAVEAARAGEAGMGFAVVADEVRNLAQRSALAARDTAAKIEGVVQKIAQGVEISAKVANTLHDIVTKARQVDGLVTEVAAACKEQSQGIAQVNTAVTQMDNVTQCNAARSEEIASAARELSTEAEALEGVAAHLQELVDGRRGVVADARSAERSGAIPAERRLARALVGVSAAD